jgi:hypothetical protein
MDVNYGFKYIFRQAHPRNCGRIPQKARGGVNLLLKKELYTPIFKGLQADFYAYKAQNRVESASLSVQQSSRKATIPQRPR